MLYSISFFSGTALILLFALFFNKRMEMSVGMKIQIFGAALGISLLAVAMYILFPIGWAITILVILILLVSLILATRFERETVDEAVEWDFPLISKTFDKVAAGQENLQNVITVEKVESMEPVLVADEPELRRKQRLVKVGVDESEELMTGRRRKIQDKEE